MMTPMINDVINFLSRARLTTECIYDTIGESWPRAVVNFFHNDHDRQDIHRRFPLHMACAQPTSLIQTTDSL